MEERTTHGINYACDVSLFKAERLLWLVVCGLFFSLAIYWTADAWKQWKEFPVITSVLTTGRHTLELAFSKTFLIISQDITSLVHRQ